MVPDRSSDDADPQAAPRERPSAPCSRAAALLVTYGSRAEVAVAATVVAVGVLVVPITALAALTALPTGSPPANGGESSFVTASTALLNAVILLTALLSALVVARALAEASISRRANETGPGHGIAYVATRVVQAGAAAAFLAAVVGGGALATAGILGDAPPSAVVVAVAIAAVALVGSVLGHAVVRVFRRFAGSDDGPASA